MNDDDDNTTNQLSSSKTLNTQANSRRKDIEEHHQIRIKEKEDQAERTRLLQLAMDWDCIDIAKEFIFQSSLDNILVGYIFLSKTANSIITIVLV